jgi:hypothetical protein
MLQKLIQRITVQMKPTDIAVNSWPLMPVIRWELWITNWKRSSSRVTGSLSPWELRSVPDPLHAGLQGRKRTQQIKDHGGSVIIVQKYRVFKIIYRNYKVWREDSVNSVAVQGNNRAAVFSMRSVPATIGKLFRPMVNSVTRQCCINKQQ